MPNEPLQSLPSGVKVTGVEAPNGGQPLQSLPNGAKVLSVKKEPAFDPFYRTENKDQLENTIKDIVATSRHGEDDEGRIEVLKGVLTNPNTTPEQAKEAVRTIQGYDPKHGDKSTMYYVKMDKNGVLMPKALAYGERPPQDYDVAKVFSSREAAKNDSWYTDVAKTIYNGALSSAEGALALAQQGYQGVAGESSDYLNRLRNVADGLKINKDEDLNKQVYNTEGVESVSDLFDPKRFDVSPASIWGTLNSLGESLMAMKGGFNAAKGLKAGNKTATFVGSYLTNLGKNLDNANEVGLDSRDASALAALQTGAMSLLDIIGPTPEILGGMSAAAKKQLFKNLATNLERDAAGKITKESFEKLAKELPTEYVKMAMASGKEFGKDVGLESITEAGQEFVKRASEQLWDKMSDEDKAKFGTDALTPKAFASYIQNGIAGLFGGVPMAGIASINKARYDEQSKDVFGAIKKGEESVKELKANLDVAKNNNQISQSEYDNAVFKIDAYNNYYQQAKDLNNITNEDKKELLELSFNVDALKAETDLSPEEISKLDPVAVGKINVKKGLIKDLQSEIDKIIRKNEVQTEEKVGEKTVADVAKDVMPQEGENTKPKPKIKDLLKELGGIPKSDATEINFEEDSPKVNARRAALPKFDEQEESGAYKFNLQQPLEQKEMLHDYFDANPDLKNELDGNIVQAQNNVWKVDLGNGRYMQFARSIEPDKYIGETHDFPDTKEAVKDSSGQTLVKYTTPVGVRLESIKSDSTPSGRKRVVNIYNKATGKHIAFGKATKYGTDKATDLEVKQYNEIKERDNREAFNPGEITPNKDVVAQKPAYFNNKSKKESVETITLSKPKLSLNFIRDNPVLKNQYGVEKRKTKSGNTVSIKVSVAKKQAEIEADFKKLEKLINCIYG